MIPRHVQIALILLFVAVVGMGFYARRLMRQAEQPAAKAADTRPIAPPVAGPAGQATLLVADDSDGILHQRDLALALPAEPGARAKEVLRALVGIYLDKGSTHPLGSGADIQDVYLLNGNTAVIDINPAFAAGHPSGVLVEGLTVASLVQTLAANVPGITRVKILVDGKERETLAGHADLMDFYDTAAGSWPVGK